MTRLLRHQYDNFVSIGDDGIFYRRRGRMPAQKRKLSWQGAVVVVPASRMTIQRGRRDRQTRSGTGPVERDVLGRIRRHLEVVAERIDRKDRRFAPGDEVGPVRFRCPARSSSGDTCRVAGRPGQCLAQAFTCRRSRPQWPKSGAISYVMRARSMPRPAPLGNIAPIGRKPADAAAEDQRQHSAWRSSASSST